MLIVKGRNEPEPQVCGEFVFAGRVPGVHERRCQGKINPRKAFFKFRARFNI